MKRLQKILLLLIFLGLLLFTFVNAKKKNKKPEEIKMVIGFIPHVQFAPLYAGMEKGIFEKHGIKLEIEYGFGIDAFSLLLNNKIDCTLSDADQLIVAREKNLKLKSFFQYYQNYPVSIVAKDNIKSPADLSGKTIGVPELFGTSYIGTRVFLAKYNLVDKVKLIKTGYTQIPSLISGKIDAAACFYNNEPVQLKLMGEKITEWKVKDFSNLVGASFIASEKSLKSRRKLYKNFSIALKEAVEWTINNQDEALEIAYKQIGNLKEDDKIFWTEVLAKTCELFKTPAGYGSLDKKKYSETIEILYNLGLIKKKISVKDTL